MEALYHQILQWLNFLSHSIAASLSAIGSIDPTIRIVATGTAVMLELFVVTGFFVPGDSIVVVASAVVASPMEGILLAVSITIGSLLGEMASYGLGRWIGRASRARRVRRFERRERFASVRSFLTARGGPAILAARFVPLVRSAVPFVVGLNRFPFGRFIAWSVSGSIAWSAIYVSVFALVAAPLRQGTGSLLISLGLAVFGFVLFAASYMLQFLIERGHRSDASVPPIPATGADVDA